MDIGGSEPDTLAGEYALGVLEGEDLAVARRLVLTDRNFAEQVSWWNHWLANTAEAAGSHEPSQDLWPAIERRLEGLGAQPVEALTPATPSGPRGFFGWNLAGAIAGAAVAAAAITFFIAAPGSEPETPASAPDEAPENRLVAQVQSEDGTISLTSVVEQRAGRIALNISGLEPGNGRASELWIVPSDGSRRSLGQIPESGSFRRELSEQERPLFVPRASLAVTYEDSETIPHAAPTSDILVIGGLSQT